MFSSQWVILIQPIQLTHLQPADIAWRERLQVLLDKKGIVDRKINGELSSFSAIRVGWKQMTVFNGVAIAGRPEDEVMYNTARHTLEN